jgi:hypothetical protein
MQSTQRRNNYTPVTKLTIVSKIIIKVECDTETFKTKYKDIKKIFKK